MIGRLLAPALTEATKSVLLLGPRQTGKSTLIRALRPELEINLARESEFLRFAANPDELEERMSAVSATTVFIDEIQRMPALINTVQALLDDAKHENRRLKFYLTGSSAPRLKRGHANLLPGRIFSFQLGPLTTAELGGTLDVERAMELGTLPEPYLASSVSEASKLLDSYAGTYLREEIQTESLSRNILGFSRFLGFVAAHSGQTLDISKLSTKAKVSRTSATRYFELLEDTLIVHRIPPYLDAKTDMVKHPRFYIFDTGVLNGLLGNFKASSDRRGMLFEHVVVSQLLSTAMAFDRRLEVSTFRTRGGLEVDFIAKLENAYWAIEAKSSSDIDGADSRPLIAARDYLPPGTKLVVVGPNVKPRKLKNGVDIMPLSQLLHAIFAGTPSGDG
ncbi:MAG: ATP-binding protein [Clostridia bacterium]|nr:ATP-binding protein [Deltaproteobacteria bacterium]